MTYEWVGLVVCAWLAADFASGVGHWWEMRYSQPTWPIIGALIAKPNQAHHANPTGFLYHSYWKRNAVLLVPTTVAIPLVWPDPFWCLTLAFVGQTNEIHAWAHGKAPRVVRVLQATGLVQSPQHHAKHHREPFLVNYCINSNLLNPILDATQFWRGLEWLGRVLLRVRPHA